MTYLARQAGARVVEIPIVFRDRRAGVSKMSRRIVVEALLVVLRLRWEALRGRRASQSRTPADDIARSTPLAAPAAAPIESVDAAASAPLLAPVDAARLEPADAGERPG